MVTYVSKIVSICGKAYAGDALDGRRKCCVRETETNACSTNSQCERALPTAALRKRRRRRLLAMSVRQQTTRSAQRSTGRHSSVCSVGGAIAAWLLLNALVALYLERRSRQAQRGAGRRMPAPPPTGASLRPATMKSLLPSPHAERCKTRAPASALARALPGPHPAPCSTNGHRPRQAHLFKFRCRAGRGPAAHSCGVERRFAGTRPRSRHR